MANDSSGAREFIVGLLGRPPLHQWLHLELTAIDFDAGTITITLPYRDELSRSLDQRDYHGGVIATLIDVAGHSCLAAKLGRRLPTIDMRVDYLRSAVDTNLVAHARIVRSGQTVGVCEVEIVDDTQRKVAIGRCVFSTVQR